MHRLISAAAVGFALFIAFTIYAANTGIDHPGLILVRVLPFGDKLGHFGLWGLLTFIVNLAVPNRRVHLAGLAVPVGTLGLLAIVGIEEASQYWLDNRTLDAADLAANIVGIVAGTAAAVRLTARSGS